MKKVLLSTAALFVIAACSSGGSEMSRLDSKIATVQELQHHNYELISINGKAFDGDKTGRPHIAFGQDMQVTGAMCNNFFGQATLSNRGVLRAKGVGMTRKLCDDTALNDLDTDIAQLLELGAEAVISDNGQYLRLSNTSSQLEFKLADKVR